MNAFVKSEDKGSLTTVDAIGKCLWFSLTNQSLQPSFSAQFSYSESVFHLWTGLSHPFLGMGPGPMELGKLAAF